MTAPAAFDDHLHVAAAVVVDEGGRILLARRAEHRHQGGLWEFPGGKVEPGESVAAALARELDEEVGIRVERSRPLIRIPHDYGDRRVLLDVHRVERFSGQAHGREGQPIAWVRPEALADYAFPAANRPIVTAARLPDLCLVTPDPGSRSVWSAFLGRLEQRLAGGVRMVQLRAKSLDHDDYMHLAEAVAQRCHRYGAHLLLNGPAEALEVAPEAGLHLSGAALIALRERPIGAGRLLSAACHDRAELECALAAGVDVLFASPVLPTATHPGAPVLGWEGLRQLCEASRVPVFALGGLGPGERSQAWTCGAQGVAAIRALWGRS